MKKKKLKKNLRGYNDCLSDCVAYFFNIHPRRVPWFVSKPRWQREMESYFSRRGYKIAPYDFKSELLSNPRKLYFVQGLSATSKSKTRKHPLSTHHMVIYKGKKPLYDPHPDERFLRGKPVWIWIISRKRPKK